MIIYQDLISHDDMFSYIYKIREMANKLCLEVSVGQRLKCLSEGLESERTDATVSTGADVVINHHLQETSFTKEFYKKHIKDYMKSIKGRLEERNPDRVKTFMRRAAEQMKRILANF